MKKLLLLLILSFFSTQGFAASCPDGSEPTKTVSADGTYYEYKCASTSAKKSTDSNREYFKVLNLISVDDQYLINLLEYSASKIKDIPANQNTLAFFFPLGENTRKKDTNAYGQKQDVYKAILNKVEMDNLFNELDDFVKQVKCFDNLSLAVIKDLKFQLKGNFRLMHYYDLCNNSGIIAYYFEEDRYPADESSFDLNHYFRDRILSHTILHEAYHTFQKILSYGIPTCGSWNMPNYRFLIEGGADYFAAYYQLARLNKLDKFDNYILRQVTTRDSTDDSSTVLGGDDSNTQYMPGLAAINLMIQKGWVDQSSILNGSFFNDCTGVRQFLLGSTKLKYLNDNWWKIERHNGNFRFNPSLSIEDEAKTYYYMMGSL